MSNRAPSKPSRREQGTALLSVLWLTAALSMIAFSVADTVRAEIERSIGQQEALRAYYLARGAVEQTLFRIRDSPNQGILMEDFLVASRRLQVSYPTGEALVEIVSEQSKLGMRFLNQALMARLLAAMGEPPANVVRLSAWFGGVNPGPAMTLFNQPGQNPAPESTFSPSRASMENVEELMLMPGISSEIMYGRFGTRPDGKLASFGGLIDCVSPYSQVNNAFDAWNVHPTLLIALGVSPARAYGLLEARSLPFPQARLAMLPYLAPDESGISLSMGTVGPTFQIRATGRARQANGALTDTRRTVSLLVNYVSPPPQFFWKDGFNYVRWYDQAYSDVAAMAAPWFGAVAPAQFSSSAPTLVEAKP